MVSWCRPPPTVAWYIASALALLVAQSVAPNQLPAQADSASGGWSNASEFSLVQTGGNAKSSTLGLTNTLTHSWERVDIKFEAGGIRTRTTKVTRTATGTASDYRIDESTESEVAAQSYYMRLRSDLRFLDRTAVFLESEWVRNTLTGIASRFVNVAGISTQWTRSENQEFRTGYGFTHTVQDDVVPDSATTGRFFGLRVTSEYTRTFGEDARLTSTLVADGNANEMSDVRADWTSSVGFSLSDHVALKTTFRLLADNKPSLIEVPLLPEDVVVPPLASAGSVSVPRGHFDRTLTVALVVSF